MKPLIVANWKMNPATLKRAQLLFDLVKKGVKNIKNAYSPKSQKDSLEVEVVICPPFIYLSHLFYDQKKDNIKLGAQDCFWEKKGAFTGEISPLMLKNLGCQYVIIGHSERRALGETDKMINKKLKAVIEAKLKPILCIGETEKERKLKKTFKVLKNQLKKDLKEIGSVAKKLAREKIENLIVAYEPVWAIGSGNFCQPEMAKEVLFFLRKILKTNLILYGGSVDSKNARDYIEKAGFQGLLVGGASLNANEFIKLVKNVSQTVKII